MELFSSFVLRPSSARRGFGSVLGLGGGPMPTPRRRGAAATAIDAIRADARAVVADGRTAFERTVEEIGGDHG